MSQLVRCTNPLQGSKLIKFLRDAVYNCDGHEESDAGLMGRFMGQDSEGKPGLVKCLAERFKIFKLVAGDRISFCNLVSDVAWEGSGITVMEVEENVVSNRQRVKLHFPDGAESWDIINLKYVFVQLERTPSLNHIYNQSNPNMEKTLGQVLHEDGQLKQHREAEFAAAVEQNNGLPLEQEKVTESPVTASDNRRLIDIKKVRVEIAELEAQLRDKKDQLKKLM